MSNPSSDASKILYQGMNKKTNIYAAIV